MYDQNKMILFVRQNNPIIISDFIRILHEMYNVNVCVFQLMQIKEKKELEEQFKRAQKPWVKLLEKCDKAKSNYHLACKNEKSAVNQERNATKDSSLSQDAVRILESSFIHYFIQTFLELFILCCVVCKLYNVRLSYY